MWVHDITESQGLGNLCAASRAFLECRMEELWEVLPCVEGRRVVHVVDMLYPGVAGGTGMAATLIGTNGRAMTRMPERRIRGIGCGGPVPRAVSRAYRSAAVQVRRGHRPPVRRVTSSRGPTSTVSALCRRLGAGGGLVVDFLSLPRVGRTCGGREWEQR